MSQRKVPPPVPTQKQPREDMELLTTEYNLDHFGMAILASLAKGQHSEQAILREYVQNAIDATNREDLAVLDDYQPEVVISVQGRSLFVYDNGIGMDWEGMDRARAIAISEKAALAVVQGGFRGIGLWSGLGIAEQLIVVTTMLGDPDEYILEIDFAEIAKLTETTETVRVLEQYVRVFRRPAGSEDHYTMVQLKNIASPYFEFFENTEDMATYISGNLPVKFNPDFSHSPAIVAKLEAHVADFAFADVKIDGKSVCNLYADALEVETPEYGILKHNGETLAYMWYCIRKTDGKIRDDRVANVAIRARGYQVGSRGYLLTDVTDSHLLNWYTGEVHIVHADLRPDVKRMELDTTPAKKWLERELKEKAGELTQFARRRSANNNCQKRLRNDIEPFVEELEAELAGELSPSRATVLLEQLESHLKYVSGGRGLKNKYIKGDPDRGIPRNDTLMRKLKRTKTKLTQLEAKLQEKDTEKAETTVTAEAVEKVDTERPRLLMEEEVESAVVSVPSPESADVGTERGKDKSPAEGLKATFDTELVRRILRCIQQVVSDSETFRQIVNVIQDELGIANGSLLEL